MTNEKEVLLKQEGKKERVAGMFNSIAHRYDFLNHFLSLGIDKIWRRKMIRMLVANSPEHILDIASGTGDLAIAAAKKTDAKIIGADIAENMLLKGRDKVNELGLSHQISFELGDSENLAFEDAKFDAVMVAFGVRNYEDLEKGLSEMYRVTKENGRVFILEFSMPKNWLMSVLYKFYFKVILPLVGNLISGHSNAYTYLPASVESFPDGEEFTKILASVGYAETSHRSLTGGIATIYSGRK